MTDIPEKSTLTGRKVFYWIAGFFGVIFIVNAIMITAAVTSFRGEDTKKSYLQGLNCNETLAKRAEQKATGWTAVLDTRENIATLAIRDEYGNPARGLAPVGLLRHPTDTALDIELKFTPEGRGVYTATLPANIKGQRELITKSDMGDGAIFETRNELWLR